MPWVTLLHDREIPTLAVDVVDDPDLTLDFL
jgi:hypothetical protein